MTEAAVGLDPFAVAHDRSFGQAGGARGVNQEARVLHLHFGAVGQVIAGLAARQLHQIGPTVGGLAGVLQAVLIGYPVTRCLRVVELLGNLAEGSEQFFADQHKTRFHQI